MKRYNRAKKLVMKPMFKQRVEKDKTKYERKQKHKGRKSDLYDIMRLFI